MKVFITGTPAVEITLINAVVDLLSKVKGPISYHAIEPLEKESIQLVVRQFDENGVTTERLEFDELINISQLYRLKYNLGKEDAQVILTSIQMVHNFDFEMNKNWFSYYKGNNIIVKTIGWEKFVGNKLEVAVSHQVIENLFQTHLKLGFSDYHMESKGCINDFCDIESDIVFKMMSGRICTECLESAFNKNIKLEYLDQIRESLNLLRDKFQIFQSLDEKIQEEAANSIIEVTKDLKFLFDGLEVGFPARLKTIYLFFLMNVNENIRSVNLRQPKYQNQILKIHSVVKKGGAEKAMITLLGLDDEDGKMANANLGDVNKDLLKDYRHDIYKLLNLKLSRGKSEYFRIDSVKTEKGWSNVLKLRPEQIKIESKMLNLIS